MVEFSRRCCPGALSGVEAPGERGVVGRPPRQGRGVGTIRPAGAAAELASTDGRRGGTVAGEAPVMSAGGGPIDWRDGPARHHEVYRTRNAEPRRGGEERRPWSGKV